MYNLPYVLYYKLNNNNNTEVFIRDADNIEYIDLPVGVYGFRIEIKNDRLLFLSNTGEQTITAMKCSTHWKYARFFNDDMFVIRKIQNDYYVGFRITIISKLIRYK